VIFLFLLTTQPLQKGFIAFNAWIPFIHLDTLLKIKPDTFYPSFITFLQQNVKPISGKIELFM